MIQTVKCKLNPNAEEREAILKTLDAFAHASNLALEIALQNKVHRAYDIHHLCYHDIKDETKLTANYVVRAIARVAQSFGKGKRPPKFFKPTSADLDKDLVRFNPVFETVSLASINGRLKKVKLELGTYQRNLLEEQKPKSGVLKYEKKKDRFYICFHIEIDTPKPTGKNPLGVDRGINRIATTSDGLIKSGKHLNYLRRKIQRTRASLQSKKAKGTKQGNHYRLLKRLSGKMRLIQKDVNHQLSKQIVQRAKETNSFIVLEDLKGILDRTKDKGKRLRRILGGWAFYQLEQFILYKAELAGVEVRFVSPRNTSKTCSVCLEIGSRNKHKFKCSQCGNEMDSDYNASLNIARLGVSVNNAEVAC